MNAVEMSEVDTQAMTANEMRSLADKLPRFTLLSKEFTIYREVFNPEISLEQTEYLNQEIMKLVEDQKVKIPTDGSFDFLEVGCGAGYTSILVALASPKCRVLATDINEVAVSNTEENSKLHGVQNQVKVVVSDVFNNKEIKGKKFDIIYWNIPWAGQSTDTSPKGDTLLQSLIDPGYQCFRRYLSEASSFLKTSGRLLVAFSFNMGSEKLFKHVASETGWDFEIISRKNFPFEVEGGITTQELDVSVVELFKKNK